MKLRYAFYTLILGMTALLGACKKWIDVQPKTQIDQNVFFASAQGFKDALNGVYLKMGTTPLYGKELTFGLVDVIAGNYNISVSNGSVAYQQAFAANYTNTNVQPVIDGIWSNQYNAIANINNLLQHIDEADPLMFAGKDHDVIKGEALGLRAFLHFDLLRLFTTAPANGGVNTYGVPYVTTYAPVITPRLNVKAVLINIMNDLKAAENLLKADSLYTKNTAVPARDLRFNYYAVKAVEARVYLWQNDQANALAAAQEVIAVAPVKFPFILQSIIAASAEANKDRVFTTEHIFGLNVTNLANNYAGILDSSRFTNTLVINAARQTQQFETATIGLTDYRNVYLIRNYTTPTAKIFFGKLYQPAGIVAAYANRMPLIKIPEMYYIAAECLATTNPTQAIAYLNTVRTARGITTPLASNLTASTIQTEIMKEYWKETPLEGQMFFYYKRTNAATVPGIGAVGGYLSANYVLPLPVLENQFGY